MDRIKTQADKLWQIISNPSTAETYRKTLVLTWSLLKETGQLLWLTLCLGLVLGDWFWKQSIQTGQNTRSWVDSLQQTRQSGTSEGTLWEETGKSLLEAGKSGATLALNKAKEQLGFEVKPEPKPEPKPQLQPELTTVPTVATPPVEPPSPIEAPGGSLVSDAAPIADAVAPPEAPPAPPDNLEPADGS